jgi:hypothetical protein
MNRILGICLLIAGCHVNVAGQCSSNADCTDPARCDTGQHVCVVPQDACYPFCPSGKACIAGTCQATTSGGCTPACPSDQACINSSCKPVTQASVFLTSPKPNDFVGATVQASAIAFAPGGVSSVRFELRSTAGAVVNSAIAISASGSTFAASIPVSGAPIADGPAVIVAVLNYAGGSRESAPVSINLDNTPPVINVASDTNWYARTLTGGAPNIIVVTVPITDAGSGVASAFLQVGTGPKIAGTFVSPNWQFQLDATQASQGAEGALAFTIGAADNVGNQATPVGGSKNVDDLAPSIANVKVYLAGTTPPGTPGVTPPSSGSFLYTDNITISGELTDAGAGLAVSATPAIPSYVLTGIGGSALTVAITGCTAGQSSKCTFSVTGSLRAATFLASSGNMTLTVGADDLALKGDGVTPAHHHSVTSSLPIPVTRVKWSKTISALTSVSGLAIHPDGDVIATGVGAAANSNTLIAVHPDGTIYWQVGTSWYANNSHLGQIDNAPSIGAGGNSAPIYVATVGQDLVAINPNPTTPVTPATARLWQCGLNAVGQAMHSTPAVAIITSGAGSPYEAIFSGDDFHQLHGASFKTATTCNVANISANPNCNCKTTTSVINLGATLYQGFDIGGGAANTFGAISGTPLGTGLAFNTAVRSGALPTGFVSVTSLSTDGTLFYGMDRGAAQAYSFTAAPANGWSNSTVAAVNGDVAIEPASGGIIVNTNDKKLRSLAVSDGTASQLGSTFAANGSTLLLGSNGYLYFGDDAGSLLAVPDPGYGTSWSYKPSATAITAAPTLDCSGNLYFAAGNIVYAVITDSIYGLRQSSPWPKYQRDSRNSGNADATTFWGRDQGASANPRCVQ